MQAVAPQSGPGQLGGPIGTHGNVLHLSAHQDGVAQVSATSSTPAAAAMTTTTGDRLSLMSAVGGARKPAPDLVVPFALPTVKQVREWRASGGAEEQRKRQKAEQPGTSERDGERLDGQKQEGAVDQASPKPADSDAAKG